MPDTPKERLAKLEQQKSEIQHAKSIARLLQDEIKRTEELKELNTKLYSNYKDRITIRKQLRMADETAITALNELTQHQKEFKDLVHSVSVDYRVINSQLDTFNKIQDVGIHNAKLINSAVGVEKNIRIEINDITTQILENKKIQLSGDLDQSDVNKTQLAIDQLRNKIANKIGLSNAGLNSELSKMLSIYEDQLSIQQQQLKFDELRTKQIDTYSSKIEESIDAFASKIESLPGGKLFLDVVGFDAEKISSNIKSTLEKSLTQSATDGAKKMTKILRPSLGAVVATGAALTAILVGAFKLISMIENKARELSEDMGISAIQSKKLVNQARQLAPEIQNAFVDYEDILDIQKSLVSSFGLLTNLTKENTELIGSMNQAFGVGVDTSAKLLKLMTDMGDSTERAGDLQIFTANLAEAANVPIDAVMADVADNAELAHIFFRGNTKELLKSAVEAKRLGLSLSDMSNIANKVLDIESSLASEMQAMVLTGRQINFDEARRLVLRGDLVGATKSIIDQMGSIDDFNKMDLLQKEAIAEATGLSVEQLAGALIKQDKINKLSGEQRRKYEEATDQLENMNDQMKENILQERLSELNILKIRKEWGNVKIALTDLLRPLAEKIVPVLGFIADKIEHIAMKFSKAKEQGSLLFKIISKTGKALLVGFGILLGGGLILSVGSLIAKFTGLNKILALTKILTNKIFNRKGVGIADKVSGAGKKAPPISKGLGKVTKTMSVIKPAQLLAGGAALIMLAGAVFIFAKAMQEFAKVGWRDVAKGIVSLLALTGAVMALGAIMSSGVGTVAIIAGAAAMVILSGGLFILGKAMQEFAKAAVIAIPFFNTMFDGFVRLAPLGSGLLGAAAGIVAVSSALALFAGGSLISGIVTGFTQLFNVDPVSKLEKLAATSSGLIKVAESLRDIAESLQMLNSISIPDISKSLQMENIISIPDISQKLKNGIIQVDPIVPNRQQITGTTASITESEIIRGNQSEYIENTPVFQQNTEETNRLLKQLLGAIDQPVYIVVNGKVIDSITQVQTMKKQMTFGVDKSFGNTL